MTKAELTEALRDVDDDAPVKVFDYLGNSVSVQHAGRGGSVDGEIATIEIQELTTLLGP